MVLLGFFGVLFLGFLLGFVGLSILATASRDSRKEENIAMQFPVDNRGSAISCNAQ